MRGLITWLFLLLCHGAISQHIAISGGLFKADTVRVTIMHDANVIDRATYTSEVYSLMLGSEDYYIIRFESEGMVKYLHFYCYNIKKPTTITQNVHFDNNNHLIMWVWSTKGKRWMRDNVERTLYGPHASYKDEF